MFARDQAEDARNALALQFCRLVWSPGQADAEELDLVRRQIGSALCLAQSAVDFADGMPECEERYRQGAREALDGDLDCALVALELVQHEMSLWHNEED